jgi:hypothetical protein
LRLIPNHKSAESGQGDHPASVHILRENSPQAGRLAEKQKSALFSKDTYPAFALIIGVLYTERQAGGGCLRIFLRNSSPTLPEIITCC